MHTVIHVQHATFHVGATLAGLLALPIAGETADIGGPGAAPRPAAPAAVAPASGDGLTPPAFGEYWPGQGGYYIGTWPAMGGLPARHVIAGKDEQDDLAWGSSGEDETGATSRIDGAANTSALLTSGRDHPAAKWCAAYTADGHNDFHLPAQADLFLALLNAPQLFKKEGLYWSSTQGSRHVAFVQDFATGYSGWSGKVSYWRGRAFRQIHLTA